MSSGVCIVDWKTGCNLSNGVRFSFTLSIVTTMVAVANSSYNSNIVGMSSGVCIVDWKTSCNLSNGVSVAVSLTFPIKTTVSNGSISSNKTMSIGNAGDYTTISGTISNLSNSIRVAVTIDKSDN